MKCIVLAAGYATRMYPLTENFPKPLLEIKGKAILEWILDDISTIKQIEDVIIVTNHRFISIFEKWKKNLKYADKIKLIDDGSTENDNRLGAVKDIALCVEKENIQDDILVLAGDNLVDFSFKGFIEYFESKRKTCVMIHKEESVEKLRRTGVATLDENRRIIRMQEKPQEPASQYAVPPFYIYSQEDLPYIMEGIELGKCGIDSPGSLIKWYCEFSEIYAFEMPGNRYDIGNLEIYYNMR